MNQSGEMRPKGVTLKDNKAAFVLEVLKNFKFVKAETLTPYKAQVLKGIKDAVDEMNLIREGKLEGIPAKDLLDELQCDSCSAVQAGTEEAVKKVPIAKIRF